MALRSSDASKPRSYGRRVLLAMAEGLADV